MNERSPPDPRVAERHEENLQWVIKLRWFAVVSEVLLVVAVDRCTDVALPVGWLFLILALAGLSNVCLALLAVGQRVGEQAIATALVLDVVALTTMLYLTGGPLNPFSTLYLVYITLAAVVLHARWTWTVVMLAAVGYGVLFVESAWLPLRHEVDHAAHMRIHLKGMWIASSVAAIFIGYFVRKMQGALERREEEIAEVRAQQARNEKLTALATLAAGAAHELSTPLSTIAVASRELERELRARPDGSTSMLDDALLIRGQVARCRAVLDQLTADVGGSVGDEPRSVPLTELFAMSLEGLDGGALISIEVEPALEGAQLRVPPRSMALALRGVLKNARDASANSERVRVVASRRGQALTVAVIDRGAGMSSGVLARAGEPFFTTKSEGQGMGLGLFLTRSVLEQLRGSLTFESVEGQGTRVVLSLPIEVVGEVVATAS